MGITTIDILQKTGILLGIGYLAWVATPAAYRYKRPADKPRRREFY